MSKYLWIFNYSYEGIVSWYDFAIETFKLAGIKCELKPIPTEEYPNATQRPQFSVLDKSKIKSTFGLTIPHWKDSLAVCINKLGC